jgi:outer membrane protein OmpA-like peptidoglycan-associated protein
VPEVNLSYRGFGAQRPIASNAKPEGKAINRRVEITISELNSSAPAVSGY